MKDKQKHR